MKLNNKGFAISTVLYALVIMIFLILALLMGIMTTNRSNTKSLVELIEDELNRLGAASTEFNLVSEGNSPSEYMVPEGASGWYLIELWGAEGAGNATVHGGKGAYTSGVIWLKEREILYFYIGGNGSGSSGGANGGGNAAGSANFGGGGATDVRTIKDTGNAGLNSRIMVAGGGGGATANGGRKANGGDGGALYGEPGGCSHAATVGVSGGTPDGTGSGAFGKGGAGSSNGSGGGGGYYGGLAGKLASSKQYAGGGGSSYIAGYAGVVPHNVSSANKYKQLYQPASATYNDITDDGTRFRASKKYVFQQPIMIEGINSGSGKGKITFLKEAASEEDTLIKKSSYLRQKVRYVRECSNGYISQTDVNNEAAGTPHSGSFTTNTSFASWNEIAVVANGENIAKGKGLSISGSTAIHPNTTYINDGQVQYGFTPISSLQSMVSTHTFTDIKRTAIEKTAGVTACVTIDLGAKYDIDYIAVWNGAGDKSTNYFPYKYSLSVAETSGNWHEIVPTSGGNNEYTFTHPTLPDTHSVYSIVLGEAVIDGTYYIIPQLASYDRVMTAQNANLTHDGVTLANEKVYIKRRGSIDTDLQMWNVTKVDGDYYKLVENESGNALQTRDNLAQNGTGVNTSAASSDGYEHTYWKIVSLDNGYYNIISYNLGTGERCLTLADNSYNTDTNLIIQECNPKLLSQRWKFVNVY